MKVITAMGDPYLNEKLKEYKKYEVIGKDIQYQAGVIEMLEEIEEINILIISNQIIEEYDFRILINKVLKIKKNIEIIVFLKQQDKDIEEFLNTKKIYKIFYLNEEGYQNFFQSFIKNVKKNKDEINEEINELKSIILKTNSNIEKNLENKFIIIDGNSGSGKSSISKILAKYIASKNKKVLIIEFKNDIGRIINKNTFKEDTYIKNIEKVGINEYILSDFISFFNKLNILNIYEIEKLIEELKNKFEYIIFDFSKNDSKKYEKIFLKRADKILFIIEGNIISIFNAVNTLEKYINDYNISKNNIKIIVNKFNNYCINIEEIQEYFYDISIITNLIYNEKYTLFINSGFKEKINIEKIEIIYKNI